ncbi:MAG: alpha/beta hydrolase [Chloroflexi bacterium]|nr:alpha/beta hydrolase [Chloroflexota bacterium]
MTRALAAGRVVAVVAAAPLLVVLLARAGLMEWLERPFIYFPSRTLERTPAAAGLAYEDVFLVASDDVRVHGWFVPGTGPVTLLWFHGNGGNIGDRVGHLALIRSELGVGVFIVSYRGYGRSGGTPTEQGTYRDAEAAFAHLRARPGVDPGRIAYYGQSLGAAVATELAARHPPHALVLESPLPSIRYMAGVAYPFLPVGPLLRTRYDSLARIADVRAPVLVLHGDRDEVIPYEGGRRVYEAAREPKRFITVRGARHDDVFLVGGHDYWGAIREFLASPAGAPGR